MEKLDLHIEGMHCGSCAVGIQMFVSQMDGVGSATVDYESRKGSFEFDPAKTEREAIVKAVEELGYKAT
ncbi:MAG: heavy metal-associated domain-containing protein [bacterium]|nr:heavy metal-associated domain-containing protein [bacterium]MDZ4295938.1 heavy metal-associated domain-containing protein [Patescibacteria group bacterium]